MKVRRWTPEIIWYLQCPDQLRSSACDSFRVIALIAGAYDWSWTCCKSGAINLLWVIEGPQSASARNRRAKVELCLLPLLSFTVSVYRLLCPIFFSSLSFPPPSLDFLSRSPAGSEPSSSVLFPLIPILSAFTGNVELQRWPQWVLIYNSSLWSVTYFTQNGKYAFKTFCGIYWPFCLYLAV